MSASAFANLMSDLLQELKMPKPDSLHQKVCTLHFNGKPSIHFVNHIPEYVDVMSDAGALAPSLSLDTLQELLALNSIDGKQWPTSVTLHRATNTLVVWCRHSLDKLEVPTLLQAIKGINEKLFTVQKLLSTTVERKEIKSANTLLRMANFNRTDRSADNK